MNTVIDSSSSKEIDWATIVENAGVKDSISFCALVSKEGNLLSSIDPEREGIDIYAAMAATVFGAAEIATLDTEEAINYVQVELVNYSMILKSISDSTLLMCTLSEKDQKKTEIVEKIVDQLSGFFT